MLGVFPYIRSVRKEKMQFIGDLHSIKLRLKIGRKKNYGIYNIKLQSATAHRNTFIALQKYFPPFYHVMLDVQIFLVFILRTH